MAGALYVRLSLGLTLGTLYRSDEGGVFKSRTVGGRVETRGASEVRDSRDTRTDLPLDYLHAQPVHVRTVGSVVHRLIGRYRRSEHRKLVITSKLAADEPLRQLTLSLTLALTFSHNFLHKQCNVRNRKKTYNR